MKNKIRENNILVYSTGKVNEWYVRLWLGERKSHGIVISKIYETEDLANKQADIIAEYMNPFILI